MRIASINTNKGLSGDGLFGLEAWLDKGRPDILLIQEPIAASASLPTALAGLALVSGNHFVAAYAVDTLGVDAVLVEDRWLRAAVDRWILDNVYFPHESKTERQHFFERLTEKPAEGRLIVGDFNMAPRPEDGRYGDSESAWTGARERKAFGALLKSGLVDLGEADPHHFTFQRRNKGEWTRFRCDLALVTAPPHGVTYQSDPMVRNPTVGFTDHSALIVDLPS